MEGFILFILLSVVKSANGVVISNNVSDLDLTNLMQSFWDADINRLKFGQELQLNLQSRTQFGSSIDKSPSRLLTLVADIRQRPTFNKLITLLNNYNPYIHESETTSEFEKQEQDAFLSSILNTKVWSTAGLFLQRKGYIRLTAELRTMLKRTWFLEYSRAKGLIGSSGFEHVFVGELDSTKKSITGFHNWVSLYMKEQAGSANYLGYLSSLPQCNLYDLKFTQGVYNKTGNSMFIGTSPEFDMAVYTICFLARPETSCAFKLNGHNLSVKTFKSYNGGLATAYVNF